MNRQSVFVLVLAGLALARLEPAQAQDCFDIWDQCTDQADAVEDACWDSCDAQFPGDDDGWDYCVSQCEEVGDKAWERCDQQEAACEAGHSSPAPGPSPSQSGTLPPIDLPISNSLQETPVWCWAAVAQQIIRYKQGAAPQQCEMVAIAFNHHPTYCCPHAGQCMTTGHLQQIQALISYFGGSYSQIAPPTDPLTLYQTLQAGRPIILAVASTPYSGHVVVLRGMHWYGGQPYLHINDPIGALPEYLPYQALIGYWQAAIVVH